MDSYWEQEFRERMDRFGAAKHPNQTPVSIKIRITSGCFHREHSTNAYAMIDDYLRQADLRDVQHEIVEHESGPEILVYLALTTAGLGVVKSIIDLITAIIKARSEGIKRGDHPDDPLELIVRGYSNENEYYEEKILKVGSKNRIGPRQIQDAFAKLGAKNAKKPKKKSNTK